MLSILFFLIFVIILVSFFFFFNDTSTTEIYTLSLHDALPICCLRGCRNLLQHTHRLLIRGYQQSRIQISSRSEEHTSELQSRVDLVCRLLLEKKKKKKKKKKIKKKRTTSTINALRTNEDTLGK